TTRSSAIPTTTPAWRAMLPATSKPILCSTPRPYRRDCSPDRRAARPATRHTPRPPTSGADHGGSASTSGPSSRRPRGSAPRRVSRGVSRASRRDAAPLHARFRAGARGRGARRDGADAADADVVALVEGVLDRAALEVHGARAAGAVLVRV